jgi:class 3 adenylate cyclase
MTNTAEDQRSRLAPFLSRIVVGWAEAAPEKRWRAVEGTLVYIEVSGFTSLSPRLAPLGEAGTEELASTVSAVFSDLLSIGHSAGGSVLKFSGTSLVLLFEGVAHAARACRAGRQMQSEMSRRGLLSTSGGHVQLTVSVGISTGTVDLFRVGRSHRELIVAGPAATTAVVMALEADGEVVISPATAQRVGRALAGEARGAGYRLRDSPGADLVAAIGAFPPMPLPGVDLISSIPAALREPILSGAASSGHDYATIGVVRFSGLDGLLSHAGRVVAAAALDDLVSWVQRAVDDEGICFLGTEVGRDGGRIVLVAGAPAAVDNGEARMLRAAQAIEDLPGPLSVRVGMRRGHVFVGPVGPACRRAYAIVGHAYDVASAGAAVAP